ncbi:NUDIX domain-containing protein [Actinacidiphila bryophytorum]|uniref:Nudix hydrolase domain-containing protein n=1 Tax=Actinacidiphila bryophytorum TaxID=1436133 RepID=A0A9W4H1X4_9ACTN|nr:NUDIX hydrolase [Actinacidiphila bryophytorum]CAG7643533.1 hypothetical protein SBRY_30834 [Actinacidiphila bryophytorum]
MSQPQEPVAQPRTAAGGLIFDEADLVLLVNPAYEPGSEIPGGYLRPGETPREGAARELWASPLPSAASSSPTGHPTQRRAPTPLRLRRRLHHRRRSTVRNGESS